MNQCLYAEQKRSNRDLTRAKRAATRINKPLQICVQGGEKVQRAEIRRELAKTKAASVTS